MNTTKIQDLLIKQGETFIFPFWWETEPIIRKPITSIDFSFGAPRLGVTSHGAPASWRVTVFGVRGCTRINAENNPPADSDYHPALIISPDMVELNDINPVDDSGRAWPAYIDGGFLQYNSPVDISGFTARMKIRKSIGGTLLASSDPADAPLDILTLTVDPGSYVTRLIMQAEAIAAATWKSGVYDIEMVSPLGVVTRVLQGKITISREATS